MGTYTKIVSRTQLEINLFELKIEMFNNGACSCFKDCDCYAKKGQSEGFITKYTNGLLNVNGKERQYINIEGCKASFNALKQKQITILNNQF